MRASILAAVVAGLVGVLAVSIAQAFVPEAERIAKATAKANDIGARTQALQLDLTLRVADREPIGTGQLITHPTGLARLELRDAGQRVERHLLLGTEHSASSNGDELDRPREFLPPLFFLQVDSPATLQQALADYGLDVDAAALAPCGKRICYVLGDRSRVAPPSPPSEEELRAAAEEAGEPWPPEEEPEPQEESEPEAEPAPSPWSLAAPETEPVAAIWVDAQSFEIRRIDSRSGVSVVFGPTAEYGDVRFPDSITIREPERDPVRFDILGVTPVNAPAAGFRRAWLLAPPAPNGQQDDRAMPTAPANPPGR
jgi:hypothetical protein